MNSDEIYKYSFEHARENNEIDQWHENKRINVDCSSAIDEAINKSHYDTFHYKLADAVKSVIDAFGVKRVTGWLQAPLIQNPMMDVFQKQTKIGRRLFQP